MTEIPGQVDIDEAIEIAETGSDGAPTADQLNERGRMKLSVLIASSGRTELQRAIDSVVPQLQDGDEIFVHINNDCPWGHASRNLMMDVARGDYLLFLDDDDAFVPDALQKVRSAVAGAPDVPIHMFKMDYGDHQLWGDQEIRLGNVSTIMFCVKRELAETCIWEEHAYEGDYFFISEAAERADNSVAWHDIVTGLVRPEPA
jgi:glycosyltransferase involved in cell wall biosynthesis